MENGEEKMKFYDKEGNAIIANAITKPKFSDYAGRHWEWDEKKIDGKKTKFHYEVSRGFNYYFHFGNKWYRMPYYPPGFWKRYYHTEDVEDFFTK